MNTSVAVVPPYLSRERVEGKDVRRDDDIRVTDADADDDRHTIARHIHFVYYITIHTKSEHIQSDDFTHVLAVRNEEKNVRLLNSIYSHTPVVFDGDLYSYQSDTLPAALAKIVLQYR